MKGLDSARILLVGGPGGVGKTTSAAALGVALAQRGQRTLVLTVDPARRLAQALGLEGFSSDDIQTVSLSAKGTLFASMLDTQRYFDRIIARFAKSEAQKQKIFNNPLYRTMVTHLGGTHEYAAMERLLEISDDPRFDRIVVDTPPAANAIELFRAPERLAAFMDNRVLRWFQGSKPGYLKWIQKGTQVAVKLLERVFGAEFLGLFSELMSDIEGMQSGFRERHLEVIKLLRGEDARFLLVTLPTESRFEESVQFIQTLEAEKISLHGIILNRVEEMIPSLPQDNAPASLRSWWTYENSIVEEQRVWVEKFRETFQGKPLTEIPRSYAPLHDIAGLSQMGERLLG